MIPIEQKVFSLIPTYAVKVFGGTGEGNMFPLSIVMHMFLGASAHCWEKFRDKNSLQLFFYSPPQLKYISLMVQFRGLFFSALNTSRSLIVFHHMG